MRLALYLLPAAVLLHAACQRTDRGTSIPSTSTPISAGTTPDAPLRDTRWVLRRIASQPVADTTGGHQPYLLITAAGTAQGQASCNMFRATLQPAVNDGELQFSPLLSTRMACPALSTERIFTQALQGTRAYRIKGDTLWLYGNAELLEFQLLALKAICSAAGPRRPAHPPTPARCQCCPCRP